MNNKMDIETEIDVLMAKHDFAKAQGLDLNQQDKQRLLKLLFSWALRGTLGYPVTDRPWMYATV
jgi:hypothetical protein